MLISFKVKILVLSAIPSLVETWTAGFGFKPIGDEEKQELTNVSLMLFPGTILLKKNLVGAPVACKSGCNIFFLIISFLLRIDECNSNAKLFLLSNMQKKIQFPSPRNNLTFWGTWWNVLIP